MLKKLAGTIYDIMEKKWDFGKTFHKLKRVYTCTDSEARVKCKNMYVDRIAEILIVLTAAILLGILLCLKSVLSPDPVILDRQGYGGDVNTKTLRTEVEGREKNFDVEVLPLEYSKDEMEEVFKNGFEEIDRLYLGDNVDPDNIQTDMDLPERLDDLGLDVTWSSSDQSVITTSGKLVKNEDGEAELISLNAVLSYGEQSAEQEYEVRVVGKKISAGERAVMAITDHIRNIQTQNRDSQQIKLPSVIEGYEVRNKGTGSGGGMVMILGVFAATCIWMGVRSKISKLEKIRKQQLMQEYPELVDKLTLYLGAGVTVRGALTRMIRDDGDENALDRELRYTLNEIKAGVPEGEAYYNLGHRINLPVYMKLMSMLSQNVNKGTKDIMVMMAGEEQAAIQARKELAKKKGEEAGTKLLFPMIVLLGIVMVIVVLPAIMSF